jgi:glucose/arabinose dehydrogenase/PKD repeat protein
VPAYDAPGGAASGVNVVRGGADGVSAAAPSAAVAAPAGFTDTLAYTVTAPTAIASTPDRRLLITQDAGQLRVVRNGRLVAAPALDLAPPLDPEPRVCSTGERGLLGVTADPAFATNHFIYLFWTFKKFGTCEVGSPRTPVNRIARYTLGNDDKVVPGSERVLVDNIASPATNHNAGDLRFGSDGLLYATTGDGGCKIGDATLCAGLNPNSRRLDILNGKVLRVTRNGGIPTGNPFSGTAGARRCGDPAGVPPGSGPCLEAFAWGFRNPFRFALQPGTNRFLVNDVGQATWEEVDALVAGRDYGWNLREGPCARDSLTDCGPTTFQNPVFSYSHADGCASITGGAFVPAGLWPEPWSGSYLFADFVCGGIYRMAPAAGGGYTRQPFLPDAPKPVHLAFGPHGDTSALYYLDYVGNAVHRVSFTSSNTAPVARFSSRPAGLDVTFQGQDSFDPDTGDTVARWRWNFGDGTATTTASPSVVHRYATKGPVSATLRVVDTHGTRSLPQSHTVYAGFWPPTIDVGWPAQEARFSVGQSITLSATADDVEDGALPGSAITWTVLRQHGTHTHPYAGPAPGSSIAFDYPAPEDLASTTNSYLVVRAVARDAQGLTTTATRRLLPRTVPLSFETSPPGGTVIVGGTRRVTPLTMTSWANAVIQVDVRDQSIGGVAYVFDSWSDGGARAHGIRTPTTSTTYTARMVRQ